MPMVCFYTHWKHQKTPGFLMLSGGIERDPWYVARNGSFKQINFQTLRKKDDHKIKINKIVIAIIFNSFMTEAVII